MPKFSRARPRSIRARAAAGSVLAAAVILVLAIPVTSLLARAVIEREEALAAGEAAREVVVDIQHEPVDGEIRPHAGVFRIQVVSPGGDVLAATPALAGSRPLTQEHPAGNESQLVDAVCAPPRRNCLTVVGFSTSDSAYGDALVYAAVSRSALLTGPLLELTLISLGAAVLASVAGIAWWQAGRTLRPVEAVRSGLARITASDPDKRLPVPDTDDEIAALARTANETLRRLEVALDRQRGFASDASHELRNPIAGLRTRLEVELADPDSGDAVAALRGALGDTLRLERIVSDLLELARLDADAAVNREPVDLGELAAVEVERRTAPLRTDSSVERGTYVYANRLRLTRLLTNLLGNAERHARERVLAAVAAEGREAVLRVHDDGNGVPEQDRERIFDRFARLDESRRRDPGGTGLGLAISREIARAHDGTLDVEDSPVLGGAVFVLRLPRYQSADGRAEEHRARGGQRRNGQAPRGRTDRPH